MRIRPSAARLDVVAGAEAGNTHLPLRLRGLENRTVGERRDGRRHARPAMDQMPPRYDKRRLLARVREIEEVH